MEHSVDFIASYSLTVYALGLAGLLLLVQLLVADIAGIRAAHKPGHPIAADGGFLFRATRAHANTNESIAAFALLALAGMHSAAHPQWLNGLALVYLLCRVAHMGFYYGNLMLPRSIAFGFSALSLLGMFTVVALAWAA